MAEMTYEEFAHRIEALEGHERAHLKRLLVNVVHAYTTEGMQGVVVTGDIDSGLATVLAMHCDELEAANLLNIANEFFEFMALRDAPPKEQFN